MLYRLLFAFGVAVEPQTMQQMLQGLFAIKRMIKRWKLAKRLKLIAAGLLSPDVE